MTLDDLKDAVPFETIMVRSDLKELLYAGINKIVNVPMVCESDGYCVTYIMDLGNWSIKPPKPKLKGPDWRWENLVPYNCNSENQGQLRRSYGYYNEECFNIVDQRRDDLYHAEWKRKVGEPIWINEGWIPCNENGEVLK